MDKKTWPKSNADVCIRCATCMAVCPVSRVTPLFPGPKQAGPGAERFRKSGDSSVDEWIDLCIGCHLCDMACSSGVNISELNLMAKAKYLDEKGRPLRDWFLTHSFLFAGLASFFSAITNFLLKNQAVKWIADSLLRIERRRELPAYQSPTFRQWFRKRPSSPPFEKGGDACLPLGGQGFEPYSKDRKKVAYFYGCYTNTNEVDVGKATVQVLEANGLEVILPPQECCGLPMLGNGNFKGARKMGLKNVPSLLKAVRSGLDILFSSTSCGHMIRHDYSHLLAIPGTEEVAHHLFDLFEFLRNLRERGNLNIHFKELPLKIAYFPPCHLRSLGIGLPALEILRLIPGLEIENIEADCCGMGGTFGFKKEKYEISQEIGKDLKEAIDRLNPEIVLTDCEGCRMQIRHLTGLKVLHPIQILRDALSDTK
ncbi:MAG: sn-glycerol-3-phosphate dehydrogenase subunit C [Deltaproteobacteria bacterium RBG_16_49_23]|nr:MAG: sn-glycerol-3-phosphate dehydrogenase subunit C [Deltaproteobacteria bacterium RBG_16_49_23]